MVEYYDSLVCTELLPFCTNVLEANYLISSSAIVIYSPIMASQLFMVTLLYVHCALFDTRTPK